MTLHYNVAHQPRELIDIALDWKKSGRALCLVTLINIEGNAPYPIGSQMLIDDQANYVGQITGGCAEQAIAEQGKQLIKKGHNQVHRYGIGSPYFDIQLPCGSGLDVHFNCKLSCNDLERIAQKLKERKVVESTINNGYSKNYYPTPRLLIAGQGPILISLTELALKIGFDVACVVQDKESKQDLQDKNIKSSHYGSISKNQITGSDLDAHTAVVSLFHEHDLEQPLLLEALNSPVFYIGALGSRRTHQARLETLTALGFSKSDLTRIYGPVGLQISASTPQQIAISILAQLIEQQNSLYV